jgi:epoxyqueuosine reductase
MENSVQRLYAQLEGQGLKGRAVPVHHLQDLQDEIRGRHAQGQFDDQFYHERLAFFSFSPPDDFPAAASLLVVAVPRPQCRIRFTWKGKTWELVLPPTYAGYSEVLRHMEDLLTGWLALEGAHVAPGRLPEKALAVRSGLAEYGRNNICYVPGMGSFFQPVAFYSDLPCPEDPWCEPRMMDRCQECQACRLKCPTGAIPSDRFLLRAERCLVFHNERSADHPFPPWIDPEAHNSVMGCMVCQQYCPEDKRFLEWFEDGEEFSAEETSLLLRGVSSDQLPAATRAKLERVDLLESLEILPRNLGVLLRAAE